MKYKAIVLLVSALSAGFAFVASAEPVATDAEKDGASHAYLTCLFTAADHTDDQTSDAATIADAIQGLCGAEYRAWQLTMLRGLDDAASAGVLEALEHGKRSVAINVVLRERQIHLDGKHPSSN